MRCSIENIDKNKPSCYTCVEMQVGGEGMRAVDICKDFIERSSIQQKDVAEKMGWTPQGISNKFRRNSLSADEFIKLLEILGYELKIVEKDTSDEVFTRRKGVGARLRLMVNGVKYDTYKADAICHSDESEEMFYELYRDTEGRYFVAQYVKWDGGVSSISPIGEEDAAKLMQKHGVQY